MDLEGHGGLRLTDLSRPVLRGEERLMAAPRRQTREDQKTRTRAPRAAPFANETDQRLWDALRARRRELAANRACRPYVVFHDATLAEMVARRPQTLSELAHVSGVGERKLAAYGADFIAVIRARGGEGAEAEAATGGPE